MKFSLQIALGIFVAISSAAAGATAQISDQILIEGETEMLFTEPMEDAFRANPRLRENLISHVSEARCTASWRGYAATWEIREKALYLIALNVDPCSNGESVPLIKLFADAIGPVKATWFTGTLTIPRGRQIEYVHMGYESRYERYLYLEVDKGNVTRSTLAPGIPRPIRPPTE